MIQRATFLVAVALGGGVCGACGPETTSFRTTDRSDPERPGPPSAPYTIKISDQPVAQAYVWSTGGYVSSSDEPMTQVGFQITSSDAHTLTFDTDALELVVFDSAGTKLPPPRFTAWKPLEPTPIRIQPGTTAVFAAYFALPVRPRAIDSMQVRWTVRDGDGEYHQITGFVRDDDAPIADHARPAEAPPPPARAPLLVEPQTPRS